MIPVVLHHGLFGFGHLRLGRASFCYFRGIERGIAERGHPVIVTQVHPTGGIARRARQLKESILRQMDSAGAGRQRIIIIAHSMGGLDARYMIRRLGMEDRVAALVTVATPHHGSPYADCCIRNLGQRLGVLQLARLLRLDVEGINDLTTTNCRRFNEEIPDSSNTRYFSVSCARPWHLVPPWALPAWRVVHAAEGENDSLVSVRSAQWGEHLGTWPADHFHAVNHRLVIELKNRTGDITPYYLGLLDRLKAEGIA